jgi:Rieske Fe-S protein
MASCEVCGNDYDKAMTISRDGEEHVFDSFECAIHAMAPRCEHCGCTIIGHGVEGSGRMFCCAHCASASGVQGVADRADAAAT